MELNGFFRTKSIYNLKIENYNIRDDIVMLLA